MVVTAQHLASETGAAILRQGGNAVDAAVAVGFALAVTHPCCGNIGGGGFMIIHFADGRNTFINFREKAPLAARADMYLDAHGNPVSDKSLERLSRSGRARHGDGTRDGAGKIWHPAALDADGAGDHGSREDGFVLTRAMSMCSTRRPPKFRDAAERRRDISQSRQTPFKRRRTPGAEESGGNFARRQRRRRPRLFTMDRSPTPWRAARAHTAAC